MGSGSFVSRVFDGSVAINWTGIAWTADLPDDTSLAIAIRTGSTPIPDSSWTPFTTIAAPGALTLNSRYIQYRADLASTDATHTRTPVLSDIRISGAAPPAPVPMITPTIGWPTPAPITYGTALGPVQLTATVSPQAAEGSFTYNSPAGTVLMAGDHMLSVTFTPTDTVHYTSANASVTIRVNKAQPIITWPTPAAITYGTALSTVQLNATASVAGAFVYSPTAGTVLGGGEGQALSVTFTPSDSNYNVATAGVPITVLRKTPTIAWARPAR